MPTLSENNSPLIIGHRGASALAPENTMAAFDLAIEAGADGIEFDVHLTRDGVPVVIHDDTLLRTGGMSRHISEMSLSELSGIDVGSWFQLNRRKGIFSGQTIPTLTGLLRWAAAKSTFVYLEMKSGPNQREVLAEAVAESLEHFALKDRVIIESFDLDAIKIVKALTPNIKTAALFEPSVLTPPGFRTRRLLGLAADAQANELALHHRLVNERLAARAKAEGFKVVVWTVDDPKWINKARELEIAALITNNPALLVAQRNTVTG
ncbi:MAG TPA: glycerophosphodiester phosphodiesterase family protein [Pyrinomonadaceae bacterium]|nr:glycerophosphodiester phosphodiesterase family protein [Pyrinomonadaceae bacterium]